MRGGQHGSGAPDLSFWHERHRPRGYQACTGDCRSSSASLRPVPDLAATRFADQRRRRGARRTSPEVAPARRSMIRGVPEATHFSLRGRKARCCATTGVLGEASAPSRPGLHGNGDTNSRGDTNNHVCGFVVSVFLCTRLRSCPSLAAANPGSRADGCYAALSKFSPSFVPHFGRAKVGRFQFKLLSV